MIYVKRGLEKELAMKVAEQLSAQRSARRSHARRAWDRPDGSARARCRRRGYPPRALRCFAVVPIAALLVAPAALRIPVIATLSLVSLAALGALGGHLGGAPIGRAALRVTLGGALAMAVTAAIGRILGVSVG